MTDDWLAYTPEGYYDGSPGVERFLAWRVGDELLTPRALAPLDHPDRVAAALAVDPRQSRSLTPAWARPCASLTPTCPNGRQFAGLGVSGRALPFFTSSGQSVTKVAINISKYRGNKPHGECLKILDGVGMRT